ncbi:AAA family ATPase [Hoeflea sp.]|uniref:AAA family ATPase n=1 Tax=Hoeflea sp. TaxID=1940281 RepID=UPI003B019114
MIVGPPGVGKSTLASELASRSGITNFELDEILYKPDWRRVPHAEFRHAINEIVEKSEWIVSGNYAGVRDLLWTNADVVVWLDLPLNLTLCRLVRRTLHRILTREVVAGGNRETFKRVFSNQSIILWAMRSQKSMRKEYEQTVKLYDRRVSVVRLRSGSAQKKWTETVSAVASDDLPSTIKRALRVSLTNEFGQTY